MPAQRSEKDGGEGELGADIDLQALIDALEEPLTVIRPNYRVVCANRAARALLRNPGAGEPLCYHVSHRREEPCHGADHPCPMSAAAKTGEPIRVLHEHFNEQGEKRSVEIFASPLWDDEGRFQGIVESQRDVTHRVRAERQLKEYAAALEATNRLKDLFIDIMRHDMMNPAWGIGTMARALLRRDGIEPGLKEDLEAIAAMSRKMIDLIQNASVLAKLEASQELSLKEEDLAALAESVVEELRAAAAERGVTLRVDSPHRAMAQVNPVVGVVLLNLVGNGIKYGPAGGTVTLAISDAGSCWRIEVADRGEGVPEDQREKIFTRFTRLAKEGVKGTGLGLAIVKRIVEAHHGRVWVEDNPGGGGLFVAELPKARPAPARPPSGG